MKYDAVIFDMDGLLLDTERLALLAFTEACAVLKVNVDKTVYMQCIGTTEARTRNILTNALGDAFPYDELARLWSERYKTEAIEKPVALKEGARELLERIHAESLPMALATSTDYDKAVVKLKNTELFEFFDIVVTGDQVKEGKPHPETYIKAAEGLGQAPKNCLAVEDSDNGVRSAYAAGMAVIQIPDLVEPAADVRSLRHLILRSLRDVKYYL
jgi:HAD superfamily hydrolase (TIGR01509 family)